MRYAIGIPWQQQNFVYAIGEIFVVVMVSSEFNKELICLYATKRWCLFFLDCLMMQLVQNIPSLVLYL